MQDVRRALGTDVGGAAAERPAADFEDAVWSCTNCYACEQACPARIRHVDYVLDFRRALVDENRLDEQKSGVLQALDRNSNPYRLPSHERAAWLMELPYAEEITFGVAEPEEPPEYLYWIGCGAAYDERSSQVVRATMDLLRAAGVSFVTLGPAEPCCGEPAKRLGEEGRFQMLAMVAIEMIKETGAQKIVTHCPHGLNTFLYEYPALGFTIPAVHHAELLAELVAAGRLDLDPGRDGRRSPTTSPAISPGPAARRPRPWRCSAGRPCCRRAPACAPSAAAAAAPTPSTRSSRRRRASAPCGTRSSPRRARSGSPWPARTA